jgi:hypothetical protein
METSSASAFLCLRELSTSFRIICFLLRVLEVQELFFYFKFQLPITICIYPKRNKSLNLATYDPMMVNNDILDPDYNFEFLGSTRNVKII